MMKDNAFIVLAVIAIIALVIVGPLITIWSMNTLFPVLAIPYDIWTWLATVFLFAAIRANVSVKRKG
jgi:tryptophan-rich sensory protein